MKACEGVTHNVKAWLSCPKTSDAPFNDLHLLRQIKQYYSVNPTISQAASKKFQAHLWYIGPEMLPLALFSDKLQVEDKRQLIAAIRRFPEESAEITERGIKLDPTHAEGIENKALHDLVTAASLRALCSIRIDVNFMLNSDPKSWNDSPIFQQSKSIVDSLKVVNDAAERSVALMSTFNESITKTESEMQKVVQVVEDHTRRVPDARKTTLKSYDIR